MILIKGIAGGGKTSALLRRITFLLHHNRKWLEAENVLLFSPNYLLSDYTSTVPPSLGRGGVPTQTLKSYISQLLPEFSLSGEQQQGSGLLLGEKDPIQVMKSGLTLVDQIDRYIQSTTSYGPLFRDTKVSGRTILLRESIHQWYRETNEQFPLYHRLFPLQTRLLKKLGGLQKNETCQQWVEDLAEGQLRELYATDPSLKYTEQKERFLCRELANQIVCKRFR